VIAENIQDCLLTVVGLSDTQCPCADTGKPEGYGISQSGYFLTDQDEGVPVSFLGAAADCGTGGLWDMLARARQEGIRRTIADVSTLFGTYYNEKIPEFNGKIGKTDANSAVSGARGRAVVQLKSKMVPATLKLKGFSLYSNLSGDIVVNLVEASDITTVIATVTVTTVAGKWTPAVFATPPKLDLYDENEQEGSKYYLTWLIPSGDYPRANTAMCSTCPGAQHMLINGHVNYVETTGWSVNALSEMNNGTALSHGSRLMGISLDVSAACSFGNFFCGMSYDTYNGKGFQWMLANAIKHAGVISLCQAFLDSPNYNQFTLLSREQIYGKRSHSTAQFSALTKWIVQNMPPNATRCFECRDDRIKVRTKLV
jgi:hypothetical protein